MPGVDRVVCSLAKSAEGVGFVADITLIGAGSEAVRCDALDCEKAGVCRVVKFDSEGTVAGCRPAEGHEATVSDQERAKDLMIKASTISPVWRRCGWSGFGR